MAAPHRAHKRTRYMRAGRAWMALRWALPRAIIAHCCAPPLRTIEASSPAVGSAASRLCIGWPLDVARDGRRWAALSEMARRWAADARCWSATLAVAGHARCALAARRRAPPCENFSLAAAAGRPPLRRVSSDVVTASLNSSRVWFGPVPGSP
ncbi:hypothetical protein F511_26220 [Dorcoceras hygrometricum]|uniref:Uncharacterized protein n=1 Tax=Dorcoceras hygrometricum TaxID=472368 RepID=A0A2Z7B281_9LAMI|nr:hypothetical protein F511_26220 [Dorcoceras hygrometricum]